MFLGGCQVKYKKISFDWDNTIAMSYMIDSDNDSELPIYTFQGYNEDIINIIKDYYNKGIELHIVTSRKTSLEEYYPEDSVLYQLKVLKLEHIFPSVRVHFTEGDLKGKVLGVHDGIINYTIGQRKGIKVSGKVPLYVVKIDAEKNEIFVGPKKNLIKST